MHLSRRARSVSHSLTLALAARARELAAEGRDVVNMAVGEPDFPAPAAAREAAAAKATGGDVRYTPAGGTPALRAALAEHLTATRGQAFTTREVCVTTSGKHALSLIARTTLDPGDEVLIPAPAWSSYVEIVRLVGAFPVVVPCLPGGGFDVAGCARSVTPRTRAIWINTPSNPTGHVWSRDELAAVARLAQDNDLWIVSDEIYRRLLHGDRPFTSPVQLSPEVRARTLIVDGASKVFAMTGYRIGFAAGPAEAVGALERIASQELGSPPAVSQEAYLACLGSEPPEVEQMARTFTRRRDLLIAGLTELGLRAPQPHGAFYAFPDLAPHLGAADSADAWCAELLEQEAVVLVPGSNFMCPTHARLSFALGEERIAQALERIGRFLARRPAGAASQDPGGGR